MLINFNAAIVNIDGTPRTTMGKLDKVPRPVLLKDIVIPALLNRLDGEGHTSGEEKFKHYQLAERIIAGGQVDLTPEEVVLVKERVGLGYGADVVGPAYKLLNG